MDDEAWASSEERALHRDQRSAGPARFERAFIITYGRSGSTLLQGLLNAIPGYLILGENWDTLAHLRSLYKRLPRHSVQRAADNRGNREPSEPTHPFYRFENFRDQTFREGIGLLLDHVMLHGVDPATVRCVGFKEIRYRSEDLKEKLEFLRAVYPGCALIYNIRKPEDVVESEFQRNKETAYFEELNSIFESRAASDANAHLVRYEEVVKKEGSLIGLYDFLGEPYDPATVESVLAVKHSFHKKAVGRLYSDVPRFVQVNKSLEGVPFLVIDRFEADIDKVQVGGLLVQDAAASDRRLAKAMDASGKEIPFKAKFGMNSPRLGDKLGLDQARKARFSLTFERDDDVSEVQVYLTDGSPIFTVHVPLVEPA